MPQTAAIAATKAPIALTAVTAMATGSEGVGSEESAAAVVATQLPVNDDAAAARPASGREYGDAATAMATGSEGAEAGAGESAAAPGMQQRSAKYGTQ